jgi:hypothetical protein
MGVKSFITLARNIIGTYSATCETMTFPPIFSKSAPLMLESFDGQLERKFFIYYKYAKSIKYFASSNEIECFNFLMG